MKTNRTSWIVGLLIWLAAIHNGWSFYNTSTGRWLSRDPIEEEGGVNVYGFVENDAINIADSLGLITYDVQVFDTGLQTSTSEVGSVVDHTAFSMPPTESCKWGLGNKYKTLDIKVKIGVYYRKPSDKKLKMQSGRTVEAHENAHVDYYRRKWAGTENIVNQYGKLCFCKYQCQKLRDDLMAKGAELWDWWAESQHTLLDYTDYPPDEKTEKKRQYGLAVAISKNVRAEYDALKKQFDKDCK